jgi:hypothetical protein
MADEDDFTTEDNILNDIGEGGNENDTVSEETDATETQDATGDANATDANPQSGQADGTSTEGQQAQPKASGPQDLVGRDGNVIASGGRERRFYEAAQRGKQQVDNLTKELDGARTRLQAFEDAGSVGNQYSLTPDEVTTGAQLMASYKQDPVETIKYLLTQAQSSGHNIDSVGSSSDMSAMKQMLDDAMRPFTDQRQADLDTQENNDRAHQVYNEFITKYPDASVHEDTIAQLLNEDTSLSPDAAYFKLQSYYSSKGLDWTKSLTMLQQEADARASVPQNTQQQMPDGNNITPNRVTDTAEVADVSTSTDDIIRQAMVEAGIN